MSRIVAIIGRPNVGKSTLFNRLCGGRDAIVDEIAGVTRDRHYGKAEWNGVEFSVVDTGGYAPDNEDAFQKEIRNQVQVAIDEADVLLLLVDVTTGITGHDEYVSQVVRRSSKKCFLVANKVDHGARASDAAEFYKLGLGEVHMLSAMNGSGTGELLDELVKALPAHYEDETAGLPRIAIVGQPNVGKSSLLNMLTGTPRSIVTPVAGTTRDSINTHYKAFGKDFVLIDTAGLRKKANVHEDLEFYSVMRTIKAIEESDVILLLLDAVNGITAQDINIFRLAERNKKGVVILVNKWDLMTKETNTAVNYEDNIKKKLAPFNDVPVLFVSVHEKQRILKALEVAATVYENRQAKIPTSKLNKVMLPYIEQTPPPSLKGKSVTIKYISQLPANTPVFAFFCNHPQYLREDYMRFLENKLRENFPLTGVPITLVFRKKSE